MPKRRAQIWRGGLRFGFCCLVPNLDGTCRSQAASHCGRAVDQGQMGCNVSKSRMAKFRLKDHGGKKAPAGVNPEVVFRPSCSSCATQCRNAPSVRPRRFVWAFEAAPHAGRCLRTRRVGCLGVGTCAVWRARCTHSSCNIPSGRVSLGARYMGGPVSRQERVAQPKFWGLWRKEGRGGRHREVPSTRTSRRPKKAYCIVGGEASPGNCLQSASSSKQRKDRREGLRNLKRKRKKEKHGGPPE